MVTVTAAAHDWPHGSHDVTWHASRPGPGPEQVLVVALATSESLMIMITAGAAARAMPVPVFISVPQPGAAQPGSHWHSASDVAATV